MKRPFGSLPPIRDKEFLRLQKLIAEMGGIQLDPKQKTMVQARIGHEVSRMGFSSWQQYLDFVIKNKTSEHGQSFVNFLTTNKTHFMREKKHFDYLKEVFLPELLDQTEFFAWCAAASKGHEIYSLAMTLQDWINESRVSMDFKILGTDIDTDVLSHAESGVYSYKEVAAELNTSLLKKYWKKGIGANQGLVRFDPEISKKLKFRKFNLMDRDWNLPVEFDLIFLRNVLIYFRREDALKIIGNMRKQLRPGGLLVMGYSEGMPTRIDGFEYKGTSIFQKSSGEKNWSHPSKSIETNPVDLSQNRPLQVAVVDDSPTIRKILRKLFEEDPRFEVAGAFENPVEATGFLKKNPVDVITLDIDMPKMSGVEFLEGPWRELKTPVVMVTSHSIEEGGKAIRALELGAFDLIRKPSFENLAEVSAKILNVAESASRSQVVVSSQTNEKAESIELSLKDVEKRLITVGASTGGTTAIASLLAQFPKVFPPVLIVQHIPASFSKAFAQHLDSKFSFRVKEAEDGEKIEVSTVYIAPGGQQMRLGKGGCLCVREDQPISGHQPSVDCLFQSVADFHNDYQIVCALLTGMGADGAKGMLALKQVGADTIAQDKETSVVYGMPRVATEMNAANHVLPLSSIAREILVSIGKKSNSAA